MAARLTAWLFTAVLPHVELRCLPPIAPAVGATGAAPASFEALGRVRQPRHAAMLLAFSNATLTSLCLAVAADAQSSAAFLLATSLHGRRQEVFGQAARLYVGFDGTVLLYRPAVSLAGGGAEDTARFRRAQRSSLEASATMEGFAGAADAQSAAAFLGAASPDGRQQDVFEPAPRPRHAGAGVRPSPRGSQSSCIC